MSEYKNQQNYWGQASPPTNYNFDSGFGQSNQQLEFQTYNDQQSVNYPAYAQKSFLDPTEGVYAGDMFSQDNFPKNSAGFVDTEEEPPLLEELGINTDRIMRKTLAVLNPFHRCGQIDDANYLLQDSDLAGPVANCLLVAAFLLLAGSKAHFGYIYGLATTSCILMYILLSLMTTTSNITFSSVASVLGYCLLPMVTLAGFRVFSSLQGAVGLVVAMLAVTWAALSASRLLCSMSGEKDQRLLIAYPCFLFYGIFTLIIIF